MKTKKYLKEFMKKHGISRGEIWEQHELLKLMDNYLYDTEQEVNEIHYKNALITIQKYYRKITGKKESLIFYVDFIQPIKKHIASLKTEKNK